METQELYEYHRKKLRWFRQNIFDLEDAGQGKWGRFMLRYHRDQMIKYDPDYEEYRYKAEERRFWQMNPHLSVIDYM